MNKKRQHSRQDINAFLRAIKKAVKLKAEGKRVKTSYSSEYGWQTYVIEDDKTLDSNSNHRKGSPIET